MNRMSSIVLIAFALLCGEGCRRNSEKRGPVAVLRESDILTANRPSDVLKTLTPPPKEGDLDNNEEANKLREEKNKAEAAKEKTQRLENTRDVGQEFVLFMNKSASKDQSLDKFRMTLRRKGRTDLYKLVDGGEIQVQFLSHVNYLGHILVYHKTAEDGMIAVFEVTPKGGALTMIKEIDLTTRISHQELGAALYHVWNYSKSAYVRTPEPRHASELDRLLAKIPPSAALADVARNMPQYLKDPPDARTPEKLRKFFDANAPPDVMKAYEGNLRVNINGDLRDPTALIIASVTQEGASKGALTIASNGTIRMTDGATFDRFFTR